MRFRRSDLTKAGFGRRRAGQGFAYLDDDGKPLKDARHLWKPPGP